jgi:hypothetical protein
MASIKFRKSITIQKAVKTALTFLGLFAAGVATVQIPEDPGAFETAAPAIGIAVIGAAWRAWHNMRKNDHLHGNPLKSERHWPSGYGVLLAGLSLGALAGCVTTTLPDGTQTTGIDYEALETAWAAYERLETRKAELEAAKERARADERAAIEAELRRLEPEIREAAERLGLYVPK